MEKERELYIVTQSEGAYCFDERKSEVIRAFGKPNEILLREVETYLSDYETCCRMLEMNRYERDYFRNGGGRRWCDDPPEGRLTEESEAYLQAKLYDIRRFILSLPDCDEKLFLYYHYVHRENVMRCAELLDVSRATAYRLKKRALLTAAQYYTAFRGEAL